MTIRLTSSWILPVGLAVAVAGFLVVDRTSTGTPALASTAAQAPAAGDDPTPDMPGGATQPLPPNHPPIGAMSPHGNHGAAPGAATAEPAAITWQAPQEWKVRANPNAMRIATYGVGDSSELTVSRAGGSTDANIDRWVGQFDGSARSARSEKTVHGMKVTVVRIAGTFVGGGGMTPGAAAQPQAGWAMLAAIVESSGSAYFFKLLGPSDQVDHARPAFEHMVDGIAAP